MARTDITGKRYGRLVVIEYAGHNSRHKNIWKCQCDCGNLTFVNIAYLNKGSTKSCGCIARELIKKRQTIHGLSKHPLYSVWRGMKKRCYNPNNESYKYYGEKGIKVCDEWLNFSSFYEWALKNGYKKGLSIDRINSNGNYEPSNCRWANWETQENNRSLNVYYEHDSKSMTIPQWSREVGINKHTIWRRINVYGWDFEKAISTPIKGGKKNVS